MIKTGTLRALEFDKILAAAAGHTHSGASRVRMLDIKPLDNREAIERRLGLVGEIRRLSDLGAPLPISNFDDITQILDRLRPEGSAVDPPELLKISNALQTIRGVGNRIKGEGPMREGRKGENVFLLEGLAGGLTGFPGISARIEKSVDPEGNIRDSASPRLAELRSRMRGLLARINKKLEELIMDKRTAVFLQDDFISRRSGRWVVPVRMDAKGQVPGVAHDVSRSGETAFIEPLEIIAPTNELENLEADARAEEIRILREIGGTIRADADGIMAEFDTLVYLDVLSAIARLADQLEMSTPQIAGENRIKMSGARHPLLLLLGKSPVVPLDLELGADARAMVITGPNAGGKTIAMKTAGLLILMALSGMPVPADSSSAFPLLNDLIVDIGDEQSIERSMSTFSAHVAHLSEIIKRADEKMVILMDELGTGTDPVEGAALACAVLKDLKAKGTLVLATTHLLDIVGFVQRTAGLKNAAMQFDPRTQTPLYRLKEGEPGQSRALETARRLGMPEDIVAEARRLLGRSHIELQELIRQMKEKSLLYEESLEELERQKVSLEGQKKSFEEMRAKEEKAGKEALKKAYEEAGRAVSEAKRKVYAILDEEKAERKAASRQAAGATIHEAASHHAASRAALKKLASEQQRISEELKTLCPREQKPISPDEIEEGDTVFVNSLNGRGVVIGIDERLGRLRIKTGDLYIQVPIGEVSRVFPKAGKKDAKTRQGDDTGAGSVTVESAASGEEGPVSGSINLIGLRVEEAISRLEPFLNHASIAGLNEVTIIHGIGTGQLRKAVRQYLGGHPLVENFRNADSSGSGAREGATIAILK